MTANPAGGIAPALTRVLEDVTGSPAPVRVVAWDGSQAGPKGAPTVRLHSAQALRRLLWSPGELGASQAYVTGELDVDEHLDDAIRTVRTDLAARGLHGPALWRRLVTATPSAAATLRRLGALGARPAPPPTQSVQRGRVHTPRRDRSVISHHYDLSNAFYQAILDEQMAYSCAYVTDPQADLVRGAETATYTLEDAQSDKLELVCRKLGLHERPGQRLVDVGCGWGSLTLHAAREHGARVLAVTISAEQQRFVSQRASAQGVADRVEVRLQDYREVSERDFDAVASIEMGEHVGDRNYPRYAAVLHRLARPGARVLVQQMSRDGRHPGGGPFIEAFITPDMGMRPVGRTVVLLEEPGLEVRDVHALREHYAWTIRSWQDRFRTRRAELVTLVGEEQCRVWDLYLAGSALAFAEGRMGVDQILLVRPKPDGSTGLPPQRPTEWNVVR